MLIPTKEINARITENTHKFILFYDPCLFYAVSQDDPVTYVNTIVEFKSIKSGMHCS